MGALQTFLWLQTRDLDLYSAVALLNLGLLCVALWGLLYYLVFLFSNSSRILWPLTIGYVFYFLLLSYYIISSHYTDVTVSRWALQPVSGHDLRGSPLFLLVVALLLLPQIIASFAYLTFYWRVNDPLQKRRILLVSLSILIWFASAFVGVALGSKAADLDGYQIFSKFMGLAAATTIYYAFTGLRPGSGVEANVEDESPAATISASPPARRLSIGR